MASRIEPYPLISFAKSVELCLLNDHPPAVNRASIQSGSTQYTKRSILGFLIQYAIRVNMSKIKRTVNRIRVAVQDIEK